MRFIIAILSIIVLSVITTMFLPWWMIAVCSFLAGLLIYQRPYRAFFAGFLAIALFWLVSILMKDIPNQHILSTRMAGVFGLPNYALLIAVNVFLGALIGGLSAWGGSLLVYVKKK